MINKQDQAKEKISRMDDKIKEILHSDNSKGKILSQSSRNLGHTQEIKPKNPEVEGAEMQSKGIGNLFNEIIADNLSNLWKYTDIHDQKVF
jgi:hypothetical protein